MFSHLLLVKMSEALQILHHDSVLCVVDVLTFDKYAISEWGKQTEDLLIASKAQPFILRYAMILNMLLNMQNKKHFENAI